MFGSEFPARSGNSSERSPEAFRAFERGINGTGEIDLTGAVRSHVHGGSRRAAAIAKYCLPGDNRQLYLMDSASAFARSTAAITFLASSSISRTRCGMRSM